ncbi:MAG TPA: metallophosphoesterase [Planctomycetaceae bacterium]|jgi:hypothetical protein|nr:metallophosphoesterase [Planctomycetaceae bacterium]
MNSTFRRSAFPTLLVAIAISIHAPAFASKERVVRDWQACPAIVELDTDAPIIAIGDVHGDYDRLCKLLHVAGVVREESEHPQNLQWAAGKTILVCTGDLIDKGKRSLDVIEAFRVLQPQALAAGGRVIVTMGNHEAEFLADPENDEKAEEFLAELGAAGVDPVRLAHGNDDHGVGNFLRGLPFAVRINDWFFAHACSTQGRSLQTLRTEISDAVDSEGYGADILLSKHGLLEARLKPLPWWQRQGDTPKQSEDRLRGYSVALGVHHLVMGHQPGKAEFSDGTKRKAGELTQKFGGLIFFIDVGMSSAINKSTGAALRIEKDGNRQTATAVSAENARTLLWHTE